MKDIKISYLGGGSKQWARVFMTDLALAEGMHGEMALYDIDMESAVRNMKIGEKINLAPETKSKFEYRVYDNIEDALSCSTFVIISILPGTFEEMRSDVHLPEKYGIYQSVGDTAGPGGVLRSMRTVPIYEFFAAKIRDICPDAWVINFTNPMSICTKTLYSVFPGIKAFGCCHEVFHTQDFLCDVLKEETGIEASRSEIYTEVSGINHFTWISSAKYKNIEIMELLNDYIRKFYESGHYEHGSADDYKKNPFAYANRVKMDMFKRYGVLGAAGDRHLAEFMNNSWYLDSPEQVSEWKFALTTLDFRINQQQERIEESIEMAEGSKPFAVKKSDEEAVELMIALLGGPAKISNVNLPNEGQMPGFPIGAIVETNALFSNDSVRPITAKHLPLGASGLVYRCLDNIEVLHEGIRERDLSRIFESFVNQPLCSKLTLSQAKELFREMILNTRKYLDEYYDLSKLDEI